MAKEYIERDELHETILSAYITAELCGFELSKDVVLLAIEQQPAADVSPVRYGRWNEVEHGKSGVLCECSACKEWMLFYYGFNANYCPNCGAKMDGGRDDV